MDGSPGPDYWQHGWTMTSNVRWMKSCNNSGERKRSPITNQAPTTLHYLWLQLDENEHNASADKHRIEGSRISDIMSENALRNLEPWRELDQFGVKIFSITDNNGDSLKYSIYQTTMRVELNKPIAHGESFTFNISWNYNLIDRMNSTSWGRGGYELFEKDGNSLYTMAQWYPRLCAYTDDTGWQNKQFFGRGEFALTFGNFLVKITVPEDHVVGATGECLNYPQMLTAEQYQRWTQAQTSKQPVEIVTLDEAVKAEKHKNVKGTKTWIYEANNVRDFAWTSSRKFVWDAMAHYNEDGKRAMCMSYYAKEAYPIYSRFSTKAVATRWLPIPSLPFLIHIPARSVSKLLMAWNTR
jgi:hypothetical protein